MYRQGLRLEWLWPMAMHAHRKRKDVVTCQTNDATVLSAICMRRVTANRSHVNPIYTQLTPPSHRPHSAMYAHQPSRSKSSVNMEL